MTWFRLYTEVRHDRKLRRLPAEHRWLWIVMLAIAKDSPKAGWILVSEKVPMTVEDIADEAAIEVESAKIGIESFLRLEMVEEIDGAMHIMQWDKRQFASDNATKRWKRWRKNRKDQQPSNVGPTLDERLSQQPANDEPTAPDNRVQSRIIASKAYKKNKLSASPEEPETASRLPELSAPDGAVHVQDVSDEQGGGVIPASQNASCSSKLPDEIAIEESSPPSPCSPTHHGDDEKNTSLIRDPQDDSLSLSEPSQQPAAQPAPDATQSGESLPDSESDETTPAGSSNEKTQPEFYLTKRKRKLSGWKLETFNEFWQAFAYKKGRAEAADAWLDVPNLTNELAARIIKSAEKEAKARSALLAKGGSPKWGQGWLSARRWEDWEENDAAGHDQDTASEQPDSAEDPYYSNYRRL